LIPQKDRQAAAAEGRAGQADGFARRAGHL